MKTVVLDTPDDFDGWRHGARAAIAADVRPGELVFCVRGQEGDLFAGGGESVFGSCRGNMPNIIVPKSFPDWARQVACHSNPERFALLYRILVRLQSEKSLMLNPADRDMHLANSMAKEVRRDRHKMKAFVRFRKTGETLDGVEQFVAWFEPTHHIVRLTAVFFERRFSNMHWSILTPGCCVHWDQKTLRFTPGVDKSVAPADDALEDYWRSYYASIFNPARLKISAMTSEMPKKYWKNLPEASVIPGLVREALRREAEMMEKAPTLPKPGMMAHREIAPEKTIPARTDFRTLDELNEAIRADRSYPLAVKATQAVCGTGPQNASLMIVGEQPGDQEDLSGKPFSGPAGQLLNTLMHEVGIEDAYLTNAVKHFKFEPRGKRRIHKTPSVSEIDHCRWWLYREIDIVRPKVIVALGATAIRSITGASQKVGEMRNRLVKLQQGPILIGSRHPASVLRARDAITMSATRDELRSDLAFALETLNGIGR